MKKMVLIGLLLTIGLAFAVPNAFAQQQGTPFQSEGWYCPMMQNAAQGGWYCPMTGNPGAGHHRMGYGFMMHAQSCSTMMQNAAQGGWYCPMTGNPGAGHHMMGYGY
jgi:hypothetical protein